MDKYAEIALTAAKKQNLTAADVAELGYRDIAALAGVKIGSDGSSPKDFFYENVRFQLAFELKQQELAAIQEAKRLKLESLTKSDPLFADNKVIIEDGIPKVVAKSFVEGVP